MICTDSEVIIKSGAKPEKKIPYAQIESVSYEKSFKSGMLSVHKGNFEIKEIEDKTQIVCPKCGSNQINSGKDGFKLGQAVGGAILLGPLGLLGGLAGSNTVMVTCLRCANKWAPGSYQYVNSIPTFPQHNDLWAEAEIFIREHMLAAKALKAEQGSQSASAPAKLESTPQQSSLADELGKFAKLRDQGVITEEEFQKKKAQLLGL